MKGSYIYRCVSIKKCFNNQAIFYYYQLQNYSRLVLKMHTWQLPHENPTSHKSQCKLKPLL